MGKCCLLIGFYCIRNLLSRGKHLPKRDFHLHKLCQLGCVLAGFGQALALTTYLGGMDEDLDDFFYSPGGLVLHVSLDEFCPC